MGRETPNCARVKRFRASHRRIDYVPGPEALEIIEAHFRSNPNNYSLAGVLDYLVMAGDHAITGNAHYRKRVISMAERTAGMVR